MSTMTQKRSRWIVGLAFAVSGAAFAIGAARAENAKVTCDGVETTVEELATRRGVPIEKLDRLQSLRDVGPDDLCNMPQKKLDRALLKIDQPAHDRPGDAVAWRNLRLKNEKGVIPMDGALKALEHAAAMPAPRIKANSSAVYSQIARGSWTSIGPGNIGGRIRSIAFNPANSSEIWIGSVSGGLWKTRNGGASWSIVNNFLANMAVSSIAINPAKPAEIYVGTGEGFFNGDAIQGAGVLKTTNSGVSWTRLPNTATVDFRYVNRVAISPNGTTLVAATRTGLQRSTDGGATWTKQIAGQDMLDVRWHPTDNTKAVASARGAKIWRTAEAGKTWVAATGLPTIADGFSGRVELSYAASQPQTIYASVDTSNYGSNSNSTALYRSTDDGKTFVKRNDTVNYLGTQGFFANALWVSPTSPNLVVVGGLDLWRSTDGGATFTQISQWWAEPEESAHADHHVIASPPNYDGKTVNTVYFGSDGGMYKADNVRTVAKTTGWTELNNNLGITQFFSIAGNPTTGSVVGGTQDNGTLFYTVAGGSKWAITGGGDGGFSAADPKDPNYWYGEYVDLQIHRSTKAGAKHEYIYDGITDAKTCANFIAPFILDPNNSNRMLAGGCSLWRSNNVKAAVPTWTAIKPPTWDKTPISAIAVAKGNANIIWVGYNDGTIYKTANGTAASPTWTQVDDGLPARYINRLTIADAAGKTVYVSLGGFAQQNVWRTTDAGATWASRSGTGTSALPGAPVYSLVIHPSDLNTLYVGTDIGIFYSTDAGATWVRPSSGPATVSTDELIFLGTTLYAGTHGLGVYKSATP